MQELIKVFSCAFCDEDELSVDGWELHGKLCVGTQFNHWIQRRLGEAQLIEGQDFKVLVKTDQNPKGGRPSTEYVLTLDAAKQIAMLEHTDIGHQIRQYFVEVEKKAKKLLMQSQLPVLKDQEAQLIADSYLKAADLFGVPKHIAQVETCKYVKNKTGVDYSPLLLNAPAQSNVADKNKTGVDYSPLLLNAPAQSNVADKEMMPEPVDISTHLGTIGSVQKRGREVNKFLNEIGWQTRINKQWVPMEDIRNKNRIQFKMEYEESTKLIFRIS